MHKRTLKWIVVAAVIVTPLAAQAHKMWLLPSATNVAGTDPWVTVDAAISNDLFHADHHAASLEQLVITAPDGQPAGDLKVSAIAGATRYRNAQDELTVRTDRDGKFQLTWPHAGMYWINASTQDDKGGTRLASTRRLSYTATLEVLPE